VEAGAEENSGVDPHVAEEAVASNDSAELGKDAPFAGEEEVPLEGDRGPEFEVASAVVSAAVGIEAERDGDGVVDALDEHRVGQFNGGAEAAADFSVTVPAAVNIAAPAGAVENDIEVRFEFGAVVRVGARAFDDPIDRKSLRC